MVAFMIFKYSYLSKTFTFQVKENYKNLEKVLLFKFLELRFKFEKSKNVMIQITICL